MLKFRIVLRRYHSDAEIVSKGPARCFFPSENTAEFELNEVGEGRILEVSLSENDVAKLQNSYCAPSDVEGIKRFIEHQLGYGSSWQSWQVIYGGKFYAVYDIRRLE